jgi:tight adherence protein C
MEMIIFVSIFGAIFSTSLGIFLPETEHIISRARIMKAIGQANTPVGESLPLKERVFIPLRQKVTAFFGSRTSKVKLSQISKRLGAAGMAGKWSSGEWSTLQYGLAIVSGGCFFGLFSILSHDLFRNIMLGIIGMVIGYIFPDSWLKAKAKQRKTEIIETLPDVLDLLTVSVEAGLGFDSALLTVSEKQKGVLGQEFLRVLQEIRMGRVRRDALRDMSERIEVEDLSSLIASLIQADQLGISIGGVLRNQSVQMREKRRQRAEEKAQKAPVKMMVPLVFFVFPSVFIVILGPAVIQIIQGFSNK